MEDQKLTAGEQKRTIHPATLGEYSKTLFFTVCPFESNISQQLTRFSKISVKLKKSASGPKNTPLSGKQIPMRIEKPSYVPQNVSRTTSSSVGGISKSENSELSS